MRQGAHANNERVKMLVFAALQSFITSGVASGISSARAAETGNFMVLWLPSWLCAWMIMLPVVLALAPGLRLLVDRIVSTEAAAPGEGTGTHDNKV